MNNDEGITDRYPFLTRMHPAHFEYIRRAPFNHVDQFIDALDALEPELRSSVIGSALCFVNNVPIVPGSPERDFESDYLVFKATLRRFAPHPISRLLIVGIIHYSLDELLRTGDTTDVDSVKNRLVAVAEQLMSEDKAADWLVDHIENLPENAERQHRHYVQFCERVVEKMLEADPTAF